MQLQVSSKNEFKHYPDVENNLELPENERFAIVFKMLNLTLHAKQWTKYNEDGSYKDIDTLLLYKTHTMRIDNPPDLLDENGETHLLTVDLLFSEQYPELNEILGDYIDAINQVRTTGEREVKN
jgi:hypothetical protein